MNLPTLGRIVHYKLTEKDVENINSIWTASGGRPFGKVFVGDTCAAVVVKSESTHINLQVMLDGPDIHWVENAHAFDQEKAELGGWFWPPKVS